MIAGWSVVALALAYVGGLFALAWAGDRMGWGRGRKPVLYALSLAVYCTSWTFFGSVGQAASFGYDFIPVYLGPIIAFALGWPLIRHIVRVAKTHNLTSIADFIAARYGKSQGVAAVVTLVCVIGTLPYIALQLKAIVQSVDIVIGPEAFANLGMPIGTAFIVAVILAVFALLFGTRHVDATAHQDGLILAIATESLIKLMAFLAVGAFVTISVFGSPAGLARAIGENSQLSKLFAQGFQGSTWVTVTILSFCAIFLLPRQFHVTVVENRHESDVKHAAWLFPLYLVAINIFVLPIAAAGLIMLPRTVPPDAFVLALPQALGSPGMTVVAFIGGLSAATAMVIVDCVALAIMLGNGLAMPWLLRRRSGTGSGSGATADVSGEILMIRRVAIVLMLACGFATYRLLGAVQGLAGIGLVSFAAIAQLAPAFFGGLFWRHATARGAIAGMVAGFSVWGYTLVSPWFVLAGLLSPDLLVYGPFGIGVLNPHSLLFLPFEPLAHGVFWSLTVNLLAFVGVSLQRSPNKIENQQSAIFAFPPRPQARVRVPASAPLVAAPQIPGLKPVSIAELQTTVARYLGAERTQRSFVEFAREAGRPLPPNATVDRQVVQFAGNLLTSAIGAPSSRLVLSLLLNRGKLTSEEASSLLDEASDAIQHNRDLLQNALDQVRHGMSVFDKSLSLIAWNRQFREMLRIPPEVGRVGASLSEVLGAIAIANGLGGSRPDLWVADSQPKFEIGGDPFVELMGGGQRVIEIRSVLMTQGGIVVTYADMTDQYLNKIALERANRELEDRVRERTLQLTDTNDELTEAKLKADQANSDKTRFLAAASHDVLQPLNAARLYAATLVERQRGQHDATLAKNIDASLEAVEEILAAIIDIARIDQGRMVAQPHDMSLNEVFEQLKVEFAPLAAERKLTLRIRPTDAWVHSDRRLLRRVLQNLVANALKYTRSGSVLVGVRRARSSDGREIVRFQVSDTGPGIPVDKQKLIFNEFERLEQNADDVRGLGLGLSIVDRISKMLDHPVRLSSRVGRGATFTVDMPRVEANADVIPLVVAPPVALGQLTGLTVLVIDNEPAVLDGMKELLSGWGCTVHLADGIKTALDVLYSGEVKPDIILSDYHLDAGNGLDAITTLRLRLDALVPAVIITADPSPDLQKQARPLQCTVLRKPVRAGALRAVVTQLTLKRAIAAE